VRIRTLALISAVFFALVDVAGLLLGEPVIRPAALAAFLLLAVSTALPAKAGGPPRWVLGAGFAALALHAALTMPRATTASTGYQWLLADPTPRDDPPNAILAALSHGVETAGAPLLLTLVLLTTLIATTGAPGWRWLAAAAAGAAAIIADAITSAIDAASNGPWAPGAAATGPEAAALLTPVLFGLAALALAAVAGRDHQWLLLTAAVLLAASALPVLDALATSAASLPAVHDLRGVFVTTGVRVTTPALAPSPALIAATQFTAYLLLAIAWPRYRPRTPDNPRPH
jgi:hypothetical protein